MTTIIVKRSMLVLACFFVAFFLESRRNSKIKVPSTMPSDNDESKDNTSVTHSARVGFLGNSILYFNDTPRFMMTLSEHSIQQDSCLRPSASFISLFADGNGMQKKFSTANALKSDGTHDIGAPTVASLLVPDGKQQQWDYIVMNDYTQGPAREKTRTDTIGALIRDYAPLILQSGATPVFFMTYAYRKQGANGSEDLGDTAEFTKRLQEGYQAYATALSQVLPPAQKPRIAPVGTAFYKVHEENPDLWFKLFHTDDFHPSPHGSYLIGCVLHCTIFGVPPAKETAIPQNGGPATLWERAHARVMQPKGEAPLPRPTASEAEYLWSAAVNVALSNNSKY